MTVMSVFRLIFDVGGVDGDTSLSFFRRFIDVRVISEFNLFNTGKDGVRHQSRYTATHAGATKWLVHSNFDQHTQIRGFNT